MENSAKSAKLFIYFSYENQKFCSQPTPPLNQLINQLFGNYLDEGPIFQINILGEC